MSLVPDFYSINEAKKPVTNRVFHDNDACGPGSQIPKHEQLPGRNGYRRCDDCIKANNEGR